MSGDRVLTVSEVAAGMRCSRGLIYERIRQGEIPALRMGRVVRVSRRWFEEAMAELEAASTSPAPPPPGASGVDGAPGLSTTPDEATPTSTVENWPRPAADTSAGGPDRSTIESAAS